jgi:hypothetical protein
MSKINQTTFIVSVSKLLRDVDHEEELLTPATLDQLASVIQELAGGNGILVEITQASL